MKKLYFKGIIIVIVVSIMGCSKDSGVSQQKGLIMSEISTNRNDIGAQQLITLRTAKPQNSGETVQYRWVVTEPNGKTTETVNYTPELTFLTSSSAGEHDVQLYAESLAKEGKTSSKFTTLMSDFAHARLGDSYELIRESSIAALNEVSIGAGSTDFYWPFSEKDISRIMLVRTDTVTNLYHFQDEIFVGGSSNYGRANPSSPRLDANGKQVSTAFSRYKKMVIPMNDKLFGQEGKMTLTWRFGLSQTQIDNYYNNSVDEDSAIGWALWDRNLTRVQIDWGDNEKDARLLFMFSAIFGNAPLEVHYAIAKK